MARQQPLVYYPPMTDFKKYLYVGKTCRDRLFASYNPKGAGISPSLHGLDYILSGEGFFWDTNGKKVSFSENSIIITPKKLWYDYSPPPGKYFDDLWMRFDGEIADSIMELFIRENISLIKLDEYDRIRKLFLEIHEYSMKLTTDSSLKAAGLLAALLTELKALVMVERQNVIVKSKGYIEAFYSYAGSNYDSRKLDITAFLKEHGLGYETFRKNFKKASGMYPYSYWLECKLNKAKALLEYSHKTVSEIAYALGYDNIFTFSKFFKTKTGLSPMQYRRKQG